MYHHNPLTPAMAATTIGLGGRPESLSGPELAVLSVADPGIDSRVVLFVPGALELTCALLRRGTSEVTIVRVGDGLRIVEADIAIIPQVPSPEFLERAIPCARRMLAPLGTVTIRFGQHLAGDLVTSACHQLLLHGFAAVRRRKMFGDTLLRAELPLHGRLACA